jgi:hypothetical protein
MIENAAESEIGPTAPALVGVVAHSRPLGPHHDGTAGTMAGVARGRRRGNGLNAPEPVFDPEGLAATVRAVPRHRQRTGRARNGRVHLRAGFASGPGREDPRAQRLHQDGAPNIIPRRQTVLKMRFTGRLHRLTG